MSEINTYEILTLFREPMIKKIIDSLNIKPGSKGIDAGCGIGRITGLLANQIGFNEKLIGLDFSENMIHYAKQNAAQANITFLQGDINHLAFSPDSFDWIWSMDTVWAGPRALGCPAEDPDQILNQFYRIIKPGGHIFLVFWTSQKLLPGYPLLEARLNASTSANAPYVENMKSDNHILNCKKWLKKANFIDIEAQSFVGDINGPLSKNEQVALSTLLQMFWGNSENEVSQADWSMFEKLCSRDSNECILISSDYYGFYTYTLFKAKK